MTTGALFQLHYFRTIPDSETGGASNPRGAVRLPREFRRGEQKLTKSMACTSATCSLDLNKPYHTHHKHGHLVLLGESHGGMSTRSTRSLHSQKLGLTTNFSDRGAGRTRVRDHLSGRVSSPTPIDQYCAALSEVARAEAKNFGVGEITSSNKTSNVIKY